MDEATSTVDIEDSVLNSIKKLIGIDPEDRSFDIDIMINANAAIFTLSQLGVPTNGHTVTSRDDTYGYIFGDISDDLLNQVKMYMLYKTRLAFDPPSSSIVMGCVKELLKEAEWRINVAVDPPMAEDGLEVNIQK